jgi:two-component system sensor histidine kinase KdpD
VYWNEKRAGRGTDTLPSVQATYFPLSGPRYPLGVVGIYLPPEERLSIDQEALFDVFLRQISSAIEREQLHELTRKTLVVAESERLYNTLFDTISHEFRTPVAAILGATDELERNPQTLTGPQNEIVKEMREGADRLDTLVQNLLDMTRLESGQLKLRRDWCDVNDLVGTTIRKLEHLLKDRTVSIHVEESVPLIQADHGLLEQVLVNIVRNSLVHAIGATLIRIDAYVEKSECVIVVLDDGPGIPPADVDRVFQKFYRIQGTRGKGTGLGLSIARGIVAAHGGSITCSNRPEGGAQFVIRLPLGTPPPAVELT